MNKRLFRYTLSAFLPLTALLACGQQSTTLPAAPVATAQTSQFAYVATVPLHAGDTQASLASALNATVLTWPDGCQTDCTALMGFKNSGTMTAQSLGLKSQSVRSGTKVEANTRSFETGGSMGIWAGGSMGIWAGGSMGIWAGGSMGIWAGGSMGIWAGGTYTMLPQNTAVWNQINLQQAQTMAPNLGAGVTVAVIDTGLDMNSVAFQGTLTDPSTWQDFYSGGSNPQDQGQFGTGAYGHGMNVAGIILQVAPKAKIMPLRVLGPDGSGDVASVAQAITWAVQHGANIINLSLGSTSYSPAVQNAIAYASLNNVMVVASAGNANTNKITYPAASFSGPGTSYMLSVGSVDSNNQKSDFANYQNVLELSAPGENVYGPAPLGYMASWSGTSQAAPMAAGGLALALGELRTGKVSELYSTLPTLTSAMMNSSANLYNSNNNSAYKNMLGKGRLDLAAFLKDTLKK